MSIQPYGMGPHWEEDQTDPFAMPVRQLLNDPVLRQLAPASWGGKNLLPILYSDVLDLGDKFEVHAGKACVTIWDILVTQFMILSLLYAPLDLPGVPKEELDVVISDGVMTIKGERKKVFEETDLWGNHRMERTFGKISRTFNLPPGCDCDNAEALFELGVLKVSFPKKPLPTTNMKLTIS
jgi:hypothetical protein